MFNEEYNFMGIKDINLNNVSSIVQSPQHKSVSITYFDDNRADVFLIDDDATRREEYNKILDALKKFNDIE